MTSTLTLYFTSGISIRKNFVIDSIDDYLASKNKEVITNFQYIKHAPLTSIKLVRGQGALDFIASNDIDYCSIQNYGEKVVYYFVTDKRWKGQNTLEFALAMDTLNTFKMGVDYTLSQRTRINRQHKNRYLPRDIYTSEVVLIPNDFFDTWLPFNLKDIYLFKNTEVIPSPSPSLRIATYGSIAGESVHLKLRIYLYNIITEEIVLYKEFTEADTLYLAFSYHSDGEIRFADSNGNYYFAPENTRFALEWGPTILPPLPSVLGRLDIPVITTGTISDLFSGKLVKSVRWYRNIDLISEGVTPLLYGKDRGVIEGDNQSWYLVYKGNNPLRCYLCADNARSVTIAPKKDIVPNDLEAGVYYYILPDRNNDNVPIRDASGNDISAYITNGWPRRQVVICYYLSGGDIGIREYTYHDYGLGFVQDGGYRNMTTSKITFATNRSTIYYNTMANLTGNTGNIRNSPSGTYTLVPVTSEIISFSALNRTDAQLVKIIKLPYRPTDSAFTGWQYDNNEKMLFLENLDTPLENEMTIDINPLSDLYLEFTPAITDLKNPIYESKLYHSDYYQPKFVYDSFSKVFALERVDIASYSKNRLFSFIFKCTNTINSRFLFTFTTYVIEDKMDEDYSDILVIARNNEVVIYNSEYINYIKTGFNYDVKNKERREVGQWVGFGLTTIGAIASFATGGAGIAAGIGFATSASAQFVNAVNSTAQAESAQAQKLEQLRNQKASVYGADDVDLMSSYTGNKAKYMLYEVSPRMKEVLFDLFFYTGYTSGVQGIPDTTSRTRFNFVSAEIEFDENNNLTEEILLDIVERFKSGVTFIHKFNNEWDIKQEKENWETNLIS